LKLFYSTALEKRKQGLKILDNVIEKLNSQPNQILNKENIVRILFIKQLISSKASTFK
jgi:hypothetical protein